MSVNLAKYKEPLLAAWKDVLDDKTKTDWALFGYEGQTNDLKVVSKGSGIEELVDDFNSGKIMYAFCKVRDPKTSLPKCVLINWQGEGAPIVRKGTCANHIRDIGNFFKGAHVTVNARNEEEVDLQLIIEKVSQSGSAYSFNERVESEASGGPVGTTYKRVIPRQEIDSKERDKFWEKEEQEEKKRLAEEAQRRNEEAAKLDTERKKRELNEAAQREEQIKVRSKNIFQQREAEKMAVVDTRVEEKEEQNNGDEERKGRSDMLRKQRSQEALSVISKRTVDARAVFERNTSAGQLHQLRRSISNQQAEPASPIKKQAEPVSPTVTNNGYSSNSVAKVSPAGNGLPSPDASNRVEAKAYSPVITSPVVTSPVVTSPVIASPVITSPVEVVKVQEPVRQEEPVHSQERVIQEEPVQEWAADAGGQEVEEDGLSYGLQARALYDYQAADATELTFDPGDVISHIDQIDEGWWQGLGPDGTFGLFPANYVELIQ